MADLNARDAIMSGLNHEERSLVRLSAAIASGDEATIRAHLTGAVGDIRPAWVEEVILQSYLFAGFPRALNAAREWRRLSGRQAPRADDGEQFERFAEWRSAGEQTCQTVYGASYERLRHNIRELHPALDTWMIVEGYGKVLSRPGLDLPRRELCIVAACATSQQERQLHSHLHGALHAGCSPDAVAGAFDAIAEMLRASDLRRYRALWEKVRTSPIHVH